MAARTTWVDWPQQLRVQVFLSPRGTSSWKSASSGAFWWRPAANSIRGPAADIGSRREEPGESYIVCPLIPPVLLRRALCNLLDPCRCPGTDISMDVVTGALPSIITKLGELLRGEYNLQKGVKGEIRFLQSELESMKGCSWEHL